MLHAGQTHTNLLQQQQSQTGCRLHLSSACGFNHIFALGQLWRQKTSRSDNGEGDCGEAVRRARQLRNAGSLLRVQPEIKGCHQAESGQYRIKRGD